jgi:hypothetical protein
MRLAWFRDDVVGTIRRASVAALWCGVPVPVMRRHETVAKYLRNNNPRSTIRRQELHPPSTRTLPSHLDLAVADLDVMRNQTK